MKNNFKNFIVFCSLSFLMGCTKYTTPSEVVTTPTPTVTVTPPALKFFNVMDQGATNVFLNSKQVTSVAKFFASAYINAKEGSNNIQLSFPNKNTLLNVNPILANNTKYSCFFYKVGNEWKYNLVKDDLPANLVAGAAAIRVLDFRTEAYFNYINVRLISPGFEIIDQKNRNFLDHSTFDGYTQFQKVGAGAYNIFMYNDTVTSSFRKGVSIDPKGIYSILLTTPSNITPVTDAIFHIYPDAVKHN